MFKGLTRTLLIVAASLVLLPAMVLMAAGGSDWIQKFGNMNPLF